jgi:4-diphosphocytidyl-2-C-methyl-D-erythritol kinase
MTDRTGFEPITLEAPAKINLALAVGGPDASGYHPLASWMLAVDLCDVLTLRPATGAASAYAITFADDAPVGAATAQTPRVDWQINDDLACRAHRLVEGHVGRSLPIALDLQKRIPPAMGLGGGSSDAAAMLVGLNRAFALELPLAELTSLAQSLGSDVAFLVQALMGHEPAALVTGTGEHCEPTPLAGPVHLTLVLAELACPTGAVYGAFDQRYPQAGPVRAEAVAALARTGRVEAAALFNDLAEPAQAVEPGLGDAIAAVQSTVGRPVHVTGSGAGLFVVTASAEEARSLAQRTTETTGLAAVAAAPWARARGG